MNFDFYDSPELLDIQRKAFYAFLKQGIPELLSKQFPIKAKSGNYSIELLLNDKHVKLITPDSSPRDCILKMKTYSCKLYAQVKLVCKKDLQYNTSSIVYQSNPEWVLLGQLPMMTKRGHFIINGSPRVIVHQVVRSPGIYFQKLINKDDRKMSRFYGDIIPLKGVWVRLQMTKKGRIEAKFKKGKKVQVEFLQKCLQVIEESCSLLPNDRRNNNLSLRSLYKKTRRIHLETENPKSPILYEDYSTLFDTRKSRANTKSEHDAFITLYDKLYRTTQDKELEDWQKKKSNLSFFKGLNPENAFKRKKCSENLFASFKLSSRYDLGLLGREKINEKFNIFRSFPIKKSYYSSTCKAKLCTSVFTREAAALYQNSPNACAYNSSCITVKQKSVLGEGVDLLKGQRDQKADGHTNSWTDGQRFVRPTQGRAKQSFASSLTQLTKDYGSKNNKYKTFAPLPRRGMGHGDDRRSTQISNLLAPTVHSLTNRRFVRRKDNLNTQLTSIDLFAASVWLYQLRKGEKNTDDIDHSQNRRVRTAGELLQTQFENGVERLKNLLTTKLQEWRGSSSRSIFSSIFKSRYKIRYSDKSLLKTSRQSGFSYNDFFSSSRFAYLDMVLQNKKNAPYQHVGFCKLKMFTGQGRKSSACKSKEQVQNINALVKSTSQVYNFFKPPAHLTGSTEKSYKISVKELFSTKPITGALREFFGSNPLSQYMDQTNPLAEITHKRRISSLGLGGVSRESAGMAIRGIHPTHYGRICPIETPEGKNAGLVNSLAFYTKLDTNGFLKTPYYRVIDGQIQSVLGFSFTSAKAESLTGLYIAPSDLQKSSNNILRSKKALLESVPVRVTDNQLDVFKKENPTKVQLMGISPIQMISVATSLIPFLEHNDANRALMGSNMQRQAVPLMIAERPIVGTGLESIVIVESGHITESVVAGFADQITATKVDIAQLAFIKKRKTSRVLKSFFLRPYGGQNTKCKVKPYKCKSKTQISKASLRIATQRVGSRFLSEAFCFKMMAMKNQRYSLLDKKAGLGLENRFKVKEHLSKQSKISKYIRPIPSIFSSSIKQDSFLFSLTKPLTTFSRSNQNTCITEKPLIRQFDWVQKGDILSDCSASNKGELSVGKNVLVAYIPWEGYNFEDAIVISERLVREHVYTSLHIERYTFQAQDLNDGHEWFTKILPGIEDRLVEHLEESGLPKIGSFVKEGDILVGKVRYLNKKPSSPYERLLCDILGEKNFAARNKSLYVPKGVEARVIYHKVINQFDNEPLISTIALKELKEKNRETKTNNLRSTQSFAHKSPCKAKLCSSEAKPFGDWGFTVTQMKNEVLQLQGVSDSHDLRPLPSLSCVDLAKLASPKLRSESQPFATPFAPLPRRGYKSSICSGHGLGVLGQVQGQRGCTKAKHTNQKFDHLEGRPQRNPAKTVNIFLGEKRVIQVGDKISGRHGNKGVISTILPRQDMPYLPDGTPIDLILNPLGVPSRMNVGQVLECLLGLASDYLKQNFKITAFDERYGVEASKSLVFLKLYQARLQSGQNWLFQVDFPGKTRLVDGRSGECFDQWITVGKAYILKLIHMVSEKIHARSTGPYALITQQPLRGRSNKGGQRLGEMEVWALEGFGAAYTLQELLTKKSDDYFGRNQIVDSILPKPPSIVDTLSPNYRVHQNRAMLGHPEIFKVLLCELQALCLDLGVYVVTPESYQRGFLGVVL